MRGLNHLRRRFARRLLSLPPATLVRLSGRAPVEIGGERLHPELQLLLALRKRMGDRPLPHYGLAGARRKLHAETVAFAGPPVRLGDVRDLEVDGAAGPRRARHYVPPRAGAGAPLMVFLHGGGFTVGDLDTHDAPCRLLCNVTGWHVLSIDYRLAPEHPWPAGVEDAAAAVRWAHGHARELGADPDRLVVCGDSAGGNLSAICAQRAAAGDLPPLALQVLIYPGTDFHGHAPSLDLFDRGLVLEREEMEWFRDGYLGGADVEWDDPRVSPLHAEDVSGVAPAVVVTAALDPLRDEGEAYAEKLSAAGVPTVAHRFPGQVHGFINMTGVSSRCLADTVRIGELASAALAGQALGHLAERRHRVVEA